MAQRRRVARHLDRLGRQHARVLDNVLVGDRRVVQRGVGQAGLDADAALPGAARPEEGARDALAQTTTAGSGAGGGGGGGARARASTRGARSSPGRAPQSRTRLRTEKAQRAGGGRRRGRRTPPPPAAPGVREAEPRSVDACLRMARTAANCAQPRARSSSAVASCKEQRVRLLLVRPPAAPVSRVGVAEALYNTRLLRERAGKSEHRSEGGRAPRGARRGGQMCLSHRGSNP